MSAKTEPAYQTSAFASTRWDVLQSLVRSGPSDVPHARRTWAVWASLLAHGLLLLALMFSVSWRSEPPAILQAELWGELPQEPQAQPEPSPAQQTPNIAPEPAPAATPDLDPQTLAVERVKPPKKDVKPVEKVEKTDPPKAVTKQPKPADTQAKKPSKLQEQRQANAIQEQRTAELARLNQLSAQNGAVKLGTPQQGSASGLSAQWKGKLKACVQPHLRFSDTTGANPKVEIDVQLLPSRTPVGTKIVKPSGNPAFDAAVERAILRCDPFPADTQPLPSSLNIVYRLND